MWVQMVGRSEQKSAARNRTLCTSLRLLSRAFLNHPPAEREMGLGQTVDQTSRVSDPILCCFYLGEKNCFQSKFSMNKDDWFFWSCFITKVVSFVTCKWTLKSTKIQSPCSTPVTHTSKFIVIFSVLPCAVKATHEIHFALIPPFQKNLLNEANLGGRLSHQVKNWIRVFSLCSNACFGGSNNSNLSSSPENWDCLFPWQTST